VTTTLPRHTCSNCNGTLWCDILKSKCPECQGIGSFENWKADRTREAIQDDLKVSKEWLETSKKELMDYVSGGNGVDDRKTQNHTMERLRWARDYWSFRVNTLMGELELLKVYSDGEPSGTGEEGTSHRQSSPERS
jgi:hypothetical protein